MLIELLRRHAITLPTDADGLDDLAFSRSRIFDQILFLGGGQAGQVGS